MELTQEKINEAKAKLEAVCNEYNIILVPVVVHQGNNTFSSIEIIARPQEHPSNLSKEELSTFE